MVHSNDHEEADLKLVALVRGYECGNNEKLLVRSPSGDIDVIVLFMLYSSGRHIFLDIGHGDARKIIDISCAISRLSRIHAFSGNNYISSFFQKTKKKFWKTWNSLEYLDIFGNLGKFEILQEDTLKELESFVCKLQGY